MTVEGLWFSLGAFSGICFTLLLFSLVAVDENALERNSDS